MQPYEQALRRFLKRQEKVYDTALSEIRNGEKIGCWMWYIFPQLRGLGKSRKSFVYGIDSLRQAKAYLSHPVLGERLVECCEALLTHTDKTAVDVFGAVDVAKLRSSMTLFAQADGDDSIFHQVLDRFFDGKTDPHTLALLGRVA